MRKYKVKLGQVNYNGEMMGIIFASSEAVVEEREDEMRYHQHRQMERLKLLIPGTTVELIEDTGAPEVIPEFEPQTVNVENSEPESEPEEASPAIAFGDDDEDADTEE